MKEYTKYVHCGNRFIARLVGYFYFYGPFLPQLGHVAAFLRNYNEKMCSRGRTEEIASRNHMPTILSCFSMRRHRLLSPPPIAGTTLAHSSYDTL